MNDSHQQQGTSYEPLHVRLNKDPSLGEGASSQTEESTNSDSGATTVNSGVSSEPAKEALLPSDSQFIHSVSKQTDSSDVVDKNECNTNRCDEEQEATQEAEKPNVEDNKAESEDKVDQLVEEAVEGGNLSIFYALL